MKIKTHFGNLTSKHRNTTAMIIERPIIPAITGMAGFKFSMLYPCNYDTYFVYYEY